MALFGDTNKRTESSGKPPTEKVKAMKQQGLSNNQIIQNLQKEGVPSSLIFDALNQNELPTEEPELTSFANKDEALSKEDVSSNSTMPTNEELIEAIIDEKWSELIKDISKIIEWKNKMDQKIAKIEESMENTKNSFENLQSAVVGKIGDYDKNILEVGADVKAMEKAFQNVLPVFTDNVKELSRVTESLKGKKTKK